MTKAFHLKKSKLKPKEAGNSLAIQSLRFGVFTIVGLHLKITKKKKKKGKQQAMKLKTTKEKQTSGINETKHIFFEKIDNINKCPAIRSRKKEGKKT